MDSKPIDIGLLLINAQGDFLNSERYGITRLSGECRSVIRSSNLNIAFYRFRFSIIELTNKMQEILPYER